MSRSAIDALGTATPPDTDEEAFGRLVRPWIEPLHTYLARMTGQDADALDLLQETLVRAWRAYPSYEDRGSASGWLFTIARRVTVDAKRAERPTSPLPSADLLPARGPGPDTATEHTELVEDLNRALQSLPEDRRHVFLLREQAGLTFREVAEEMDIPLGTALSHMHYAVRHLRRALEHHG